MERTFELTAIVNLEKDYDQVLDDFIEFIERHYLSAGGGFERGFCISHDNAELTNETHRLAVKEYMENSGNFNNIEIGEIEESK